MAFQDKVEILIGKLAKDTVEGNLEWSIKTPPSGLTEFSEYKYPLYLSAVLNEKTVGLYSYKYKHFHDEEYFSWSEAVGLCLTDGVKVLWEYNKKTPGLKNLFKAASQQASGVESLIDELIGSTV